MTNLPLNGRISVTAAYGETGPSWLHGHKGVDMVNADRQVYATCNGVVRVVGSDPLGWGVYISIGDDNGNRHIFCHFKTGTVSVKEGQTVSRVTRLGEYGTSGNAHGAHVHYQINNKNGLPIDPCPYMGIQNKRQVLESEDYTLLKITFKDWDKISNYARAGVEWCVANGIIKGDDKGYFNPRKNATREEIALMIARAMGGVK